MRIDIGEIRMRVCPPCRRNDPCGFALLTGFGKKPARNDSGRNERRRKLCRFQGKVLLIVNTASKCGFTPQFAGLEQLWEEYRDRGLVVVGFPSNQFGAQDPGTNDEIRSFCQANYGVSFPMMAKIDVNGTSAHPLYQWLTAEAPGLLGTTMSAWVPSTTSKRTR